MYESIDIKLDSNFQPVINTNGDFKLTDEYEGLLQKIKLEASTQEGELFFDKEYGWSLFDFIQVNEDDLTKTEIIQRCKTKMSKYDYINQTSISINLRFSDEEIVIAIDFQFINSNVINNITISLDRVNIEVIAL